MTMREQEQDCGCGCGGSLCGTARQEMVWVGAREAEEPKEARGGECDCACGGGECDCGCDCCG